MAGAAGTRKSSAGSGCSSRSPAGGAARTQPGCCCGRRQLAWRSRAPPPAACLGGHGVPCTAALELSGLELGGSQRQRSSSTAWRSVDLGGGLPPRRLPPKIRPSSDRTLLLPCSPQHHGLRRDAERTSPRLPPWRLRPRASQQWRRTLGATMLQPTPRRRRRTRASRQRRTPRPWALILPPQLPWRRRRCVRHHPRAQASGLPERPYVTLNPLFG